MSEAQAVDVAAADAVDARAEVALRKRQRAAKGP